MEIRRIHIQIQKKNLLEQEQEQEQTARQKFRYESTHATYVTTYSTPITKSRSTIITYFSNDLIQIAVHRRRQL